MAKRNLLLVDADPRSLRVLEVSLRKAGYSVTTSGDVDGALELIALTEPDLVISDTRLPGKDGFALVAALRERPAEQAIPLMFLSSDPSVESKMRGLSLGIEDYLTKPTLIREILTRIHLILERNDRERLGRTAKTRFAGSLEDMGLVDLLQTIEMSRKSGVLKLSSGRRTGQMWFSEGRVIEAELGVLTGEAAIYRFLIWSEGNFELEFRDVRRDDKIGIPTQALLMEGVRRLDEWGRLQEQLPSLDAVLETNDRELAERIGEIPDELNDVLRAFDGRRDLTGVLDYVGGDDLVTLTAISKLFFDGFLTVRHPSEVAADAQVGGHSDPFIGFVPEDSLTPAVVAGLLPTPAGMLAQPALPPAGLVHHGLDPHGLRSPTNGAARSSGVAGLGRAAHGAVHSAQPSAILEASAKAPTPLTPRPGPSQRAAHPAPEGQDAMANRIQREHTRESLDDGRPLTFGTSEPPTPRRSFAPPGAPVDTAAATVERADRREKPAEPAPSASEMHHDDDPQVQRFFSRPPAAPTWSDDFDGSDHEPKAPPQRGMYWTLGIAGAGILSIGAFLLYNKVLMPTPEELVPGVRALPTPESVVAVAPAAELAPKAATPSEAAPAPSQAAPVEATPAKAQALAEPTPEQPAQAAPSEPPSTAAPAQATSTGDYDALIAEARKLGYRRSAEAAYLKALAARPGEPEALSALSMLYLNQGKNTEARERAKQAVDRDAQSAEGWIVLGAAESALGNAQAARTAYQRCAALPSSSSKYVLECKRMLR